MPLRQLAAALVLAAAPAWAQLDVNRASPEDLDALKGIGPALAERIVQARRERPFRDWDDLQARVRGVGPSSAARLSAQGLTVGGTRHPRAAPPPAAGPSGPVVYEPMRPQPLQPLPRQP